MVSIFEQNLRLFIIDCRVMSCAYNRMACEQHAAGSDSCYLQPKYAYWCNFRHFRILYNDIVSVIDFELKERYYQAMFAEIKYIIFDLDGTLIDSSTGVIAATNFALESLGQKPRSDAEIKRFIGHPLDEMFPAFCDAPLKDLKAKFQEKAKDTVVASARALPGVVETLPKIHAAGYKLAIATTKFSNHTLGTIEKMGWGGYFSALTSGDEVKRVKPAPDIVLLALERLGADPERTVMVGDTVNDIKAAHEAGVKAIAIKSPFGEDDVSRYNPEMMIGSFIDLLRVFSIS